MVPNEGMLDSVRDNMDLSGQLNIMPMDHYKDLIRLRSICGPCGIHVILSIITPRYMWWSGANSVLDLIH